MCVFLDWLYHVRSQAVKYNDIIFVYVRHNLSVFIFHFSGSRYVNWQEKGASAQREHLHDGVPESLLGCNLFLWICFLYTRRIHFSSRLTPHVWSCIPRPIVHINYNPISFRNALLFGLRPRKSLTISYSSALPPFSRIISL